MGPLGWQETIFIFVFALLIFGPKKLPELGKTIGKAMTEFRRASSDLKSTFDREMQSIEAENKDLKQISQNFQNDLYNQDSSYYDSGTYGDYDSSVGHSTPDETKATSENSSTTVGASATEGAESTPAITSEPAAVARSTNGTAATTADPDTEPRQS